MSLFCFNLCRVVNLLASFRTILMSFSSAIVPFYNNTLYPKATWLLASEGLPYNRKKNQL